MNTNVSLEAALGVMSFLGTCFILFLAGLVFAHALWKGKRVRAQRALVAASCLMMVYLAVTLAFSFASRERALARGEEKYFCEIDCHLAYSVTEVKRTKMLGTPSDRTASERGVFYVVTVRTRFDEQTIGPRRGNGPLTPNDRTVRVIDAQGESYDPSTDGARLLALSQASGRPIRTPLRPGETYTTDFVFDLPENVSNPTLLINEGELITRFIIGHENSLLHKKTVFRLDEAREPEQQVFEKRFSLNRERLRYYVLLVRPQAVLGALRNSSVRLLQSIRRGASHDTSGL